MALLELSHVSKSYGRKAILTGVELDVDQGLTILTGPSGAGKSTLLRLIATAESPTSGSIVWEGVPLSRSRRALRQALGYAPQSVELPEDLTAREFAMHMAALKGLALSAADDQFTGLAAGVGLQADADSRLATYSGGMRRRLVFIQALLGSPRLIVLDEPTAELDDHTARQVESLIAEHAERAAIVMTTHAPQRLASRATLFAVQHGGVSAP